MNHIFNIDFAKKYGVGEAIMFSNFQYWIEKNKANEIHFYDGHYWTYNSISSFTKLFSYWSKGQIERILNSMISQGILITGNYNKNGYDKTKWYAINYSTLSISGNQEMDEDSIRNHNHEIKKPIPDINTNINTDVNTDINNYDNFSNSDLQSSETKDVENIAYNIHPKNKKEE